MNFDIDVTQDYVIIVGNNGSGKTTLMKHYLKNVNKNIMYILNTGGARDWDNFASKTHQTIPNVYDLKWLDDWIIRFISDKSIKKACLVIDDADNFDIKHDMIFKSMYINSRRLAIGGWLSVRRLNFVPIEIYNNAKYLFISRQNSDRNIWYIAETIGMELARTLKNLALYEFLAYNVSTKKHAVIRL